MEKQLLVRLEQAWSSSDVGAFLDAPKLTEIMPHFSLMEPSAKVRLLMALQVAQQELMRQHLSRERHLNPQASSGGVVTSAGLPMHLLKQILALADSDADEWVKIGSGLVRKMLFPAVGTESDFFNDYMASTLKQVLGKVDAYRGADLAIDDWFSHDLAYLNADHPKVAKGFKTSNDHFTVVEESKKTAEDKPAVSSQASRQVMANRRPVSVATGPGAPAPKAPKPSVTPTSAINAGLSKRSLTDMGSEIRRQAESGRFKRQRNRISMIDIDEVKQIESEKAQKAEERKQQARRANKAASASATDANASEAAGGEGGGDGEAIGDGDDAANEQLAETEVPDVATYEASNSLSEVAEVMQNYQDYNQLMQYDMSGNESFVVQEGLHHYDQNSSQAGMYQRQQQVQQQGQQAPPFPEPISYGQYMDPAQPGYNNGAMSNYEEARAALLQMQQSGNPNNANSSDSYQYNGGFIDSANYWR
ncbi:hypothetical protein SDRG_05279 [Saprolegnia diclina VS20]|uniref:Uncharacterized protein n=1 Tax=Saprolegnia diclina (strain VS20) TaxID=1156394 RepID=T0QSS4_SAPDV|nr:hypothetical protein SDRG_05279 [Saprolegnia diclina VS20]EQC37050.1 hypothetical protein SDRG_05279 [Saprolegnia diclina VS20]|eukprot:XP_008609212.1 hypothetical protein SDRG_05279 [Saprolegnia diclina VS20]